jgi:hypothetical protein
MAKPTNAHKFMKVYYTHCIPTTCFGLSSGHVQEGALLRIHTSKDYRIFFGNNAHIGNIN